MTPQRLREIAFNCEGIYCEDNSFVSNEENARELRELADVMELASPPVSTETFALRIVRTQWLPDILAKVRRTFPGRTTKHIEIRYVQVLTQVLDIATDYIESLEQQAMWRPIETAPRDGTYIMIGWFELPGHDGKAIAMWHSSKKYWCNTWMEFSSDPNHQPTHWMPLPKRPGA